MKRPSRRLVGAYHGCPGSRTEAFYLSEFPKENSTVRLMICTVAFGMGVDIPDIEYIFHFGISKSLLSYWQEVGRAARDGRHAEAYLFATAASKYQKPIPDKEMLELVERLTKGDVCMRVEVLNGLTVEGMDLSVIEELKQRDLDLCSEHCGATCACSLCMCCTLCEKRCPCKV